MLTNILTTTVIGVAAGDDKTRVYLLGNPVIWWANIGFLFAFVLVFAWSSLVSQRGAAGAVEEAGRAEQRKVNLAAAAWLFLGWALHYIPFWAMGRVLYVHHYYPALLFSSMLSGVLLDFLLSSACRLLPPSISFTALHTALATVTATCW